MPITANRLPESWEKQDIYRLSNGWKATVEWNQCHGPFIKRLDSPDDSQMWLASNGDPPELGADHYNKIFGHSKYVDLPDFAQAWRDPEPRGLVRPLFERIPTP